MDRSGVRQVPEGSGEQRKTEETSCEVTCAAPTTPAVKVKVKDTLETQRSRKRGEIIWYQFQLVVNHSAQITGKNPILCS